MIQFKPPENNNKYPGCVAVKLYFDPSEVQENALSSPTFQPTEISLKLAINFSGIEEIQIPESEFSILWQKLDIPGGKVTFGVRKGILKLELNGCSMPLEKIILKKPFTISIPTGITDAREIQVIPSIEYASNDSGLTGKLSGVGKTDRITREWQTEEWQLDMVGWDKDPRWVFKTLKPTNILEGVLVEKLGNLKLDRSLCQMKATFTVHSEDVRLTGGQFGHASNIHRNFWKIFERKMALDYIGPKLESRPVSEVNWCYEQQCYI